LGGGQRKRGEEEKEGDFGMAVNAALLRRGAFFFSPAAAGERGAPSNLVVDVVVARRGGWVSVFLSFATTRRCLAMAHLIRKPPPIRKVGQGKVRDLFWSPWTVR
jgi:hypothetical protein